MDKSICQRAYIAAQILIKELENNVANNIGASHLVAKGEVYGLADLAKFAGTYVKTGGSIMPITGGQSTLQNENGVIMHLEGTVNGPLDPSPTGAIVILTK